MKGELWGINPLFPPPQVYNVMINGPSSSVVRALAMHSGDPSSIPGWGQSFSSPYDFGFPTENPVCHSWPVTLGMNCLTDFFFSSRALAVENEVVVIEEIITVENVEPTGRRSSVQRYQGLARGPEQRGQRGGAISKKKERPLFR